MVSNWTAEQLQAINLRNRNLLVAAAAGAGKTAVLVERVIQLILRDEVNIDQMLVVTFTKAAASEMRERISHALIGPASARPAPAARPPAADPFEPGPDQHPAFLLQRGGAALLSPGRCRSGFSGSRSK